MMLSYTPNQQGCPPWATEQILNGFAPPPLPFLMGQAVPKCPLYLMPLVSSICHENLLTEIFNLIWVQINLFSRGITSYLYRVQKILMYDKTFTSLKQIQKKSPVTFSSHTRFTIIFIETIISDMLTSLCSILKEVTVCQIIFMKIRQL